MVRSRLRRERDDAPAQRFCRGLETFLHRCFIPPKEQRHAPAAKRFVTLVARGVFARVLELLHARAIEHDAAQDPQAPTDAAQWFVDAHAFVHLEALAAHHDVEQHGIADAAGGTDADREGIPFWVAREVDEYVPHGLSRRRNDQLDTDGRQIVHDRKVELGAATYNGKGPVPAALAILRTVGLAAQSVDREPPSKTRAIAELAVVFLVFAAIDLLRIRHALPRPVFGDEWRYLYQADNLLHGFFSPRDRVFLWNGPGYPLLITPFVEGWKKGARYANAFWHAGTMAYAWAALRPYVRVRENLIAVAALGFYGPLADHLPLIYTEVVCCFLITGWLFHSLRAQTSWLHVLVAGAYLGMLCLTKVVFGPVLLVSIAVLIGFVAYRRATLWISHLKVAVLAFALCVPYLSYTYQLTGRWLYWSSALGNTFYWLTSPYPEEWGDWYHQGWVRNHPLLHAHHHELYARISGTREDPNLSEQEQVFNLSTPESGDILLAAAMENVRNHPIKFAKNYIANFSRLFFDVPTSVRGTPFWNEYTWWNLPLLAWLFGVLAYARVRRVAMPREFWPCVGLMVLTLGAYSLSSIVARYLIPLVPPLWIVSWAWLGAIRRRVAVQH